MTEQASILAAPSLPSGSARAEGALKASSALWFLAAVAGQWLFVYYITSFYGPSTLSGDFESWNRRDPVMGYVAGDAVGNLFFAAHVLIAAVLIFGALQLVPQIRARAIAFHRWNGRLLLLAAIAVASGGLHLEWVRGAAFRSEGAGLVEAAGIMGAGEVSAFLRFWRPLLLL